MLCIASLDIETSNHNNPILILRNGYRFQHVLDYIRSNDNTHKSLMDLLSTVNHREAFFDDMECPEKGASYNGMNGNKYFNGTNTTFGPKFSTGDVISILLNMDRKTVTFYKNGIRAGTAATSGIITGTRYYPYVSFSESNQKINSIICSHIFS